MTERARKANLRLAYLVPMTPWPVVYWLQTFPIDFDGLRYKNALAHLNMPIVYALFATSGIGLVLAVRARKTWEHVAEWILFAVIHHFLLFTYIAMNTSIRTIK